MIAESRREGVLSLKQEMLAAFTGKVDSGFCYSSDRVFPPMYRREIEGGRMDKSNGSFSSFLLQ